MNQVHEKSKTNTIVNPEYEFSSDKALLKEASLEISNSETGFVDGIIDRNLVVENTMKRIDLLLKKFNSIG